MASSKDKRVCALPAEVKEVTGPPQGMRDHLQRKLAGLGYDEQMAAVRPPAPKRSSADGAAGNTDVVQMSGGRNQPAQAPPGTTDMNVIRTTPNVVVGRPVASADQGHAIVRSLAQGNAAALAPVGVPDLGGGFVVGGQTRGVNQIEWGLGGLSDGRAVIIRGNVGEVDWGPFPNLSPLAHSHPTVGENMEGKELDVSTGTDINSMLMNMRNFIYFYPSRADISFCKSRNIRDHVVHTPYRYHPPTRTIDSGFQRTLPTIDVVIERAYEISTGELRARARVVSGGVLWQGELQAGAGFSYPVGAL